MKITKLLIIGFLIISAKNSYGQTFEVPRQYSFKTAEDYAPYEKHIIEATKWLIATPLNEQAEKRKDVSAFVLKWVIGSPTVSVEINPIVMDFEKKNPGMLVLFMACCSKYVLENNYSKDISAKNKAALHDMISVYKKGIGINKDKKMDKLIKSDEEGKLDEWLAENMKTN
jgi:hypothetical protein